MGGSAPWAPEKIKDHRGLKVTAFAWEDGAPTPLAFLVL